MLRNMLLVGTGGFIGCASRYLCSVLTAGWAATPFPAGTFAVNAAGSLLIGFLLATVNDGSVYYLCVTGFCGGFTTFSAFSAETFGMLQEGGYATAAGYAAASVLTCVLLVRAGMYIGSKL